MNRTSSAAQGMMFLGDNIIHIENAVIEEVVANTGRTSYILISSGQSNKGPSDMAVVFTTYSRDFQEWWREHRPNINEW